MPAANLLAANPVAVSVNGSPGPQAVVSARTPADGSGTEPFDAFLVLQELAASASGTALDLGIDAGAAEVDGEVKIEDADGEDSIEDDPLAFLAGLLSLTAPVHPPHVAAGAAGAGDASEDGGLGLDVDGGAPADMGMGRGEGKGAGATAPAFALGEGADATKAAGGAAASQPPLQSPSNLAAPSLAASASVPVPVPVPANDSALAATRALAAQVALVTGDVATKDDSTAPARPGDLLAVQAMKTPAAAEHSPIVTHIRDPRWADEFANRIALQVNQRESVASISLTPVDLGPVDVSVTVRDSQATIHFGAAQAETRALIEASLPKLRELLAAQGFQLMDASVSSQGFRQSKPQAGPSIPRPSSVDDVTPVTTRAIVMNGLLDTYA
jgi:flagellar hook-length control protein FliK